jgi:hypothetical protein
MRTIYLCPYCESLIGYSAVGDMWCKECDVTIPIENAKEVEVLPRNTVSLSYVCAHCKAFSFGDKGELSLDNGTTFTCHECGKQTVVNLMTLEEYTEMHKI